MKREEKIETCYQCLPYLLLKLAERYLTLQCLSDKINKYKWGKFSSKERLKISRLWPNWANTRNWRTRDKEVTLHFEHIYRSVKGQTRTCVLCCYRLIKVKYFLLSASAQLAEQCTFESLILCNKTEYPKRGRGGWGGEAGSGYTGWEPLERLLVQMLVAMATAI